MYTPFTKAAAPSIRPIGAERSAECARIHAASFAYPWRETDIEQLLFAPEVFALGAISPSGQELAGFIISRVAADEAEILTIAVAPEHRRAGIGKALIAPHISRLSGLGVRRLFLEVDAQNGAALTLYAHFGFVQVGEREAYYRVADAAPSKALVMRLDLA
jgi:ribosomal-protein-alanine N-acetyltransferase